MYTIIFVCVDAVVELWKNIRSNYRRSLRRLKEWTKKPSGSGKQNASKPRPYKYTVELHFLDESFAVEDRNDSLSVKDSGDKQSQEVNIVCCIGPIQNVICNMADTDTIIVRY